MIYLIESLGKFNIVIWISELSRNGGNSEFGLPVGGLVGCLELEVGELGGILVFVLLGYIEHEG